MNQKASNKEKREKQTNEVVAEIPSTINTHTKNKMSEKDVIYTSMCLY